MIQFKVNWKNQKEIIEVVEGYPDMIEQNIIDTFKKSMITIKNYARKTVPVDTGSLRRDIDVETKTKVGRVSDIQGIIYNDLEYAIYVHQGTKYKQANPYLKRAIYNRGEILLDRELRKNILKEKRGLI